MNRIKFVILCSTILVLASSCTKIENHEESSKLPQQPTVNFTPANSDMTKLVDEFMVAIDSKDLMDTYAGDYGVKFEYVYGNDTLKEFQGTYIELTEKVNKIIKRINDTPESSMLNNFKSDLIELLTQKNILLKEQQKAIEYGGKWNIQFKHGSDVNLIMALEHYGNNQELIKKIQDYNLYAKEFIKKYKMDVQKYEFGDEKIIFLIS